MRDDEKMIEVTTTVIALKLITELYKQRLISAHTYKEVVEKYRNQ